MNQIAKVSPLSRWRIRQITNQLKSSFNIPIDKPFPVVEFMEYVLPEMGISIEILNDFEMKGSYAEAIPESKQLRISESVYDGACEGNQRDRFTLAHEIGHLLLHTSDRIAFARSEKEIKPYENPEWQANTFAGELLVHTDLIGRLSVSEIAQKYRVSNTVAEIQSQYR